MTGKGLPDSVMCEAEGGGRRWPACLEVFLVVLAVSAVSGVPKAESGSSEVSAMVLRFAPLFAEVGLEDASEVELGDATEPMDSASEKLNRLSGA